MKDQLSQVLSAALEAVSQAQKTETLEEIRVRFLGRKGRLTKLLRATGSLPPQERPSFGQAANKARQKLERALKERLAQLKAEPAEEAARPREQLDVTLPGRRGFLGKSHPVMETMDQIAEIFGRLGYEVRTGPEAETEYYNFEALNFPKDHPARDMQDTFFLSDQTVLRTHTSPVQVRTMEAQRPPVRMICLGKCFRRDSDATHTPMFHQCEGLLVDRNVSLADLKGTLTFFVRQMFGPDVPVRFRPSFFPFTEPSAEVDMGCVMCQGAGCRVCSYTGWLEILGSGMVDPAVYAFVDYDPEEYSGFAWGMGVERVCMLKRGIEDMRLFFDNDLRFLSQF
ncbi:MAG: phenylalanine--tRNA ligase subunit alpha [Deltaproteobacteria bacterium]|nr:phenylalanine--tRNA ligase subunit alpha [Deltaproteobacteria bacterium]